MDEMCYIMNIRFPPSEYIFIFKPHVKKYYLYSHKFKLYSTGIVTYVIEHKCIKEIVYNMCCIMIKVELQTKAV